MADTILKFNIEVDAATGKARLKEFGDEAERTGNRASQAGKKIDTGLTSSFFEAKNAITGFIAAAGVMRVVQFFKECAVESGNAELALTRLTNSLRSAGLGGGKAAGELREFADTLARSSMVDDDAAVAMMALSVNMGITAENAQKVAQASADAAAAMGRGPESIAGINEALARSIATGSTRALIQLGINIKDVEFKAGDATTVLKEFSKWNGLAAAEMDTFAGKANIASKSLRNMKESIGDMLTKTGATDIFFGLLARDIGRVSEFADLIRTAFERGVLGYARENFEGIADESDKAAKANQELMENVRAIVAQGGIDLGLRDDAEAAKTVADALHEIILSYGTVEAQAARWWKTYGGGKKVEYLPTQRYQQVGMTPFAPPAAMEEGITRPGEGVFAEFPASWSEETLAYADGLKLVGENMRDIISLGADYQANMDLQTAKSQTLTDVTNMIAGATANLAGQMVYAALMGEKITGRMLKSMLASLAAEATVKAVFELAEGWVDAANYRYDAAVAHWTAAKIYGTIAGVAGAASMAFSGKTGTSAGGGYSRSKKKAVGAETTTTASREVNVTVYLEGHGIITDPAAFSREMTEEIKRGMSKTGNSW